MKELLQRIEQYLVQETHGVPKSFYERQREREKLLADVRVALATKGS